MKAKKWISNILYTIVFVTLGIMLFVVISSRATGGEPELFGYQLKTVLSGSMDPTFNTGSLILVEKIEDVKALKKDDIITFKQNEESLVTHRIIEIINQGNSLMFRTKGDNNDGPDINPVLSDNVVAKYSGYTIPLLGYLLDFASSAKGTAILLIIPGLMLIGYSVLSIRQAIREIEGKTKQAKSTEDTQSI